MRPLLMATVAALTLTAFAPSTQAQTAESRGARPNESIVAASNSVTVDAPAGVTREQFRNQANRAFTEGKSASRGAPITIDEPTYNRVMDNAFALIEAGSATTGGTPASANRWRVHCEFKPFDCRVWNDTPKV